MKRLALRALIGLTLVGFFGVIASALQVRAAIEAGALVQWRECLGQRDFEIWRLGSAADADNTRLIARSVQSAWRAKTGSDGALTWQFKGAFAWLGTRAAYGENARAGLATSLAARMPPCRQN